MTARFTEVMLKAGFSKAVERTDPIVGEVLQTIRPTHGVHDLRHTAAIWRYMVERENGNPDPWKTVQVMLGHKDKQTTLRIYLQVSNTFEAVVSDRALRFFRGIADASPYKAVIDR